MVREVITFQIGTFSNYIGSHFWNIQDELVLNNVTEIDSDVLYRWGETLHGERTYTPRVLIFDLKGNLGQLRKEGYLYPSYQPDLSNLDEIGNNNVDTWGGNYNIQPAKAAPKNKFLQFLEGGEKAILGESNNNNNETECDENEDDEIRASSMSHVNMIIAEDLARPEAVTSWSDYLKPHLHPRSIYDFTATTEGYTNNNNNNVFDIYSHGFEIMKREVESEEIMEQLRFFAEECDSLQGFQTFADIDSGFAGFAEDFLTRVRDEYGTKKTYLTVGSSAPPPPPSTSPEPEADTTNDIIAATTEQEASFRRAEEARQKRDKQLLNASLSLHALYQLSSVYIPLSSEQLLHAHRHQHGGAFPNFAADRVHFHRPYHSAAVFAAAIDTATLPYRLARGRGVDMHTVAQTLNTMPSMRVSNLAVSMPLGPRLTAQTPLAEFFESVGPIHDPITRNFITHLSPMSSMSHITANTATTNINTKPFAHTLTLRGVSSLPLYAPPSPLVHTTSSSSNKNKNRLNRLNNLLLDNCTTLDELLFMYMTQSQGLRAMEHIVEQAMPVPLSFPNVLSHRLDSAGFEKSHRCDAPAKLRREDVLSLPMLSYLETSRRIHPYLSHLAQQFSEGRSSVRAFGVSADRVIDVKQYYDKYRLTRDEHEEIREDLLTLAEEYAGDEGGGFGDHDHDEDEDL